jgi:hypothetical protein
MLPWIFAASISLVIEVASRLAKIARERTVLMIEEE